MNPGEITRLLSRVSQGESEAYDELLPLVYDELRGLAGHFMRHERLSHTLQATALTHEAFLRLLGIHHVDWENRAHFFGVAARAMRRVLVDHARARSRKRRGGGQIKAPIEEVPTSPALSRLDLLALDEAMNGLANIDPRKVQTVELLFFGGLTRAEAAEVLGVTRRTVTRDWQYARRWLVREMTRGDTARGEVQANDDPTS